MKRAKLNQPPPGFPRMISVGNHMPGNTTFLGLMHTIESTPIRPLLPFPDKASYVPLNMSFDPSSSGPSTVTAIDTPSAIDARITASETPTATMSAVAEMTVPAIVPAEDTFAASGTMPTDTQGKPYLTSSTLVEQEIWCQRAMHVGLISCAFLSPDVETPEIENWAAVMTTVETTTPATDQPTATEIAATAEAVDRGEYEVVKFICDSGAMGHVIADPSLCSVIKEINGVINVTGVDSSTLFTTNKLGRVLGKVGDNVICLDRVMISDRAHYNILSLRQFTRQNLVVILTDTVLKIVVLATGSVVLTAVFEENFWWVRLKVPVNRNSSARALRSGREFLKRVFDSVPEPVSEQEGDQERAQVPKRLRQDASSAEASTANSNPANTESSTAHPATDEPATEK